MAHPHLIESASDPDSIEIGGVGTVRITHDQIEAGHDDLVNPLLELAVKMLDLDGAGDEDGDAFRCPGHVRRQAS